jgi:CheY-like chemotaxis protein
MELRIAKLMSIDNGMESHSPQRSVILAVDDDEDDIELMRRLFRKAGVIRPVEVFREGEELIAALTTLIGKEDQGAIPLLCFLDVKMPSINGHEVLHWIRDQPQLDRLAVVMLSSSEHPEDVKQAAEGGAQCYLAKYPRADVLKSVLDEAERVSKSGAAVCKEWFGVTANLLLRWGLTGFRARQGSSEGLFRQP